MTITLALSALIAAAQAVTVAPTADGAAIQEREVAFQELTDGRLAQAIAALEASRAANPDDPATLINLAAAYARQGDAARAAEALRTAMSSDTRYRLELADGTWADSRTVARRALARLGEGYPLASLVD